MVRKPAPAYTFDQDKPSLDRSVPTKMNFVYFLEAVLGLLFGDLPQPLIDLLRCTALKNARLFISKIAKIQEQLSTRWPQSHHPALVVVLRFKRKNADIGQALVTVLLPP